jgi:hypothetical protein
LDDLLIGFIDEKNEKSDKVENDKINKSDKEFCLIS